MNEPHHSPALTLFFAPGASSIAPHIALHEIGVPFTPRQGQEHADGIWAMAEQRLARAPGPWALGAYSIADIHLFRLYWRFAASRGPESARFPALQAHHDRMLARPAVQRTIAIEAEIGYELPA